MLTFMAIFYFSMRSSYRRSPKYVSNRICVLVVFPGVFECLYLGIPPLTTKLGWLQGSFLWLLPVSHHKHGYLRGLCSAKSKPNKSQQIRKYNPVTFPFSLPNALPSELPKGPKLGAYIFP